MSRCDSEELAAITMQLLSQHFAIVLIECLLIEGPLYNHRNKKLLKKGMLKVVKNLVAMECSFQYKLVQ